MKLLKQYFEKELKGHGLSFVIDDNLYVIQDDDKEQPKAVIQYIESLQPDQIKHGSKNGTHIRTIAYFNFKVSSEQTPDIFVLGFLDMVSNHTQHIIIPHKDFFSRLGKLSTSERKGMDVVLWQMSNSTVYNTTNISAEGEYYYLSKGVNGCMADNTDWDYSEFLNAWDRLL